MLLYTYKRVLFPYCTISFRTKAGFIATLKSGDLILAVPIKNFIGVLFSRNKIATLSEVISIKHEKDNYVLQLKGIVRVRLKRVAKFRNAAYTIIEEDDITGEDELIDGLRKKSQELIFLINVSESDKLIHLLNFLNNLGQLTDFISNYFIVRFNDRYKIYKELKVKRRAQQLIEVLKILNERLKNRREKVIV